LYWLERISIQRNLVNSMRLGTFHKKKKYLLNKIKVNFLSLFKKQSNTTRPEVKTCLLIHDNSKLGDLIVLSSLYRELTARGVKLSIVTTEAGKNFLIGNKKIAHFFVKKSNSFKDIMALRDDLREHHFDMVLDPFETMPSFGHSLLLASINSPYTLGFDKWYKRYYSFYHSHDDKLEAHMCTRAHEILEHIYGDSERKFDISYDLPLPEHVQEEVLRFIDNSKIIIINPLGAKKICRLTNEQIQAIYNYIRESKPEYRVIFTGLSTDLATITIPDIETLPFNDFIHAVALTKFSRYVVSVDTALVHIASAYNIPTLALYPNCRHPSYPSHVIWSPNNKNAVQVVSPTFTVKDITLPVITDSLQKILH